MALEVTAYRNLTIVRPLTSKEIEDGAVDNPELTTLRHFNPAFANHAERLPKNTAFSFTGSMGFCAGSYGGYNNWRNQLAILAGHQSARRAWQMGAQGRPFYELINFSDCEGVFGPKVSAKLAKDFADNQPLADAMTGKDGEWFQEKYTDWRTAFEMASDNGAVELH